MTSSQPIDTFVSSRITDILQSSGHAQSPVNYDIILGQGTPDLPTPAYILDAVDSALRRNPRVQYTDYSGMPELRQAIAQKLQRDNDLTYDPQTEIMVTNGAQEAIWIALQMITNPGDEFLIGDPHYTVYDEMVSLLGGRVIPVHSKPDSGFQYDLEAMESAISPNTKAIILVSPDNPTGAVQSHHVVMGVAAIAERYHLFVIADELYERFLFDDVRMTSFGSIPNQRDRCITIGGFSKGWAMTGWRVGYLAFPSVLRPAAMLIKHSTSICTAVPSQLAALAVLNAPASAIDEMMDEWSLRRTFMFDRLAELGIPVIRTPGAYYALVDVRETGLTDREFSAGLAAAENVRVSPGSAFGPSGAGFVRVSFMTPRPQLDEGLDRLGRYWTSLGK